MIPDCFWTDAFQRSNGFFGCQDIYDEEGKLETHSIDIVIVQFAFLLTVGRSYMVPIHSKAGYDQ